jgi:hypothetical protein
MSNITLANILDVNGSYVHNGIRHTNFRLDIEVVVHTQVGEDPDTRREAREQIATQRPEAIQKMTELLVKILPQQNKWILDDWKPTTENINALPEPLRKYIMELETLCDPAGMVAQIALLTDRTDALVQMIIELQTELRNR